MVMDVQILQLKINLGETLIYPNFCIKFFFELWFTPYKAEQGFTLWGMELQEKEAQ